MKSKLILPVVASLALGTVSFFSPASAQTPDTGFFFHDGDVPIVFLGDSITEQRMYTTLIETFIESRFPTWKVQFRNAGWGGDTAWLRQRGGSWDDVLQRDVLSFHPKAITIDFGMNDARGGDGTYQQYIDYQTKLVDALKKDGARVALVPSSPEEKYEPSAPAGSGYNNMLQKYSDALKAIADKEGVPFADQYAPFVKAIESGRNAGVLTKDGPAVRLIPDAVHPNWGGHLIMASSILQALHAPSLVSSATLDGDAKSTTDTKDCKIEWQPTTDKSIAFKRTDDSLPWSVPGDPMIDVALKIPGFDPGTTLNQYLLKVSGLKEPSYDLSIDDVVVGTYSSSDLAAGVNLGFLRKGPIFDQGQKLVQTVIEKNNNYITRWRQVQLAGAPAAWIISGQGFADAQKAEEARLDKAITDQEAAIDELRKPLPHVFKLAPAVTAAPAAK